jgi:hypothetical protein
MPLSKMNMWHEIHKFWHVQGNFVPMSLPYPMTIRVRPEQVDEKWIVKREHRSSATVELLDLTIEEEVSWI